MEKILIKGFKNNKPINIEVSKLILGSADFLRPDNIDFSLEMFKEYQRAGGNCIDTARQYRHSELAIADLFNNGIARKDVILLGKCCHPVREFPTQKRVNAASIRNDIEESLERLNTDYIDLYALHRDDENVPVSEIIIELNKLIAEGKVHAIGTSNWSTSRIKEANDYAEQHNMFPFTFNSPNLSLAKLNMPRWDDCISVDNEMLQFHNETKMPLLSWSSQAEGFFSGRWNKDGIDVEKEIIDVYFNEENWNKLDVINKLAKETRIDPILLSLAYVLYQEFPTCAIIGPETLEQLKQSLEITKICIPNDVLEKLNS